jgi:hypothetical protein
MGAMTVKAISEAEVGGPFAGAIENQLLLLDENGLSHHGPSAAGSDEPGDRRQQMEKQDSQIAPAPHRNQPPESLEILRNLEFAMHRHLTRSKCWRKFFY